MDKRRHHILFVDDEPLVLRGYTRSTEEYDENWDIEFAGSGLEALDILSKSSFDAIITDVYMPGMDGITLLEEVYKLYPGTLRYVLSGNTSDTQIIRSTTLVHQMFPKPCSIDYVFETVERACRLKDTFADRNLTRVITGIKKLPSLPALYNRIMEEIQSPDPDLKVIGDIIMQDAAMTAKILQVVNSAFFGLASKVTGPHRAVSLLGLNTVKALVLSNHVFSEYQGKPNLPISIEALWKHSLMVSTAARQIAARLQLSPQEQEDAQVTGILHDVGILMGYKYPEYFKRVKTKNNRIFIESEYQALGTSHAEMGAYLLAIWGLPDHIVEAVMLHHRPGGHILDRADILTALHAANGLYHMWNIEHDIDPAAYVDIDYLERVDVLQHLDDWAQIMFRLLENSN